MSNFIFPTDEQSEEFCLEIIKLMTEFFGITEEEALKRVNAHWKHIEFKGETNIIYHEDEEFWAKDIYYGHESYWWVKEGKEQLQPKHLEG